MRVFPFIILRNLRLINFHWRQTNFKKRLDEKQVRIHFLFFDILEHNFNQILHIIWQEKSWKLGVVESQGESQHRLAVPAYIS